MTKSILTVAAIAAFLPLAAQAHHETPVAAAAAADAVMPAAATAAAAAAAAAPGSAMAGPLMVSGAYARSTNPSVGAAFMTISNSGKTDCQLTGVTSDSIDNPELHTNREEGGVMKMVQIESITVPAGGSHELARGGDHIMLMKPKAPIKEGQDVALTLDFGTCGQVPLTVKVDNAAGPGPGMEGMGGMDHGSHAPKN